MTTDSAPVRWVVLLVRLTVGPARHRVAVWRELRRIGALCPGQGTWTVPNVPVFADGLARAAELAGRADGEVVTLDAAGRTPADSAHLQALFAAARREDWAEFLADCEKFEAELAKEIRTAKFTLAELEGGTVPGAAAAMPP
ncbi:Chromate resistance protein ChrB [Streptomyces sp. NPDC085944]|uniref:Chromate resistance protein ChrB n=1 Tax=Streptomyces sp. NPDC085944 TaxID=3154962 RepID=UPI003423B8F3